MTQLDDLKNKILDEYQITKEEILSLLDFPIQDLSRVANEIRQKFCNNIFDICTIINAKSGKCSENCKYCAQSSFYDTKVEEYPLLSIEKILAEAKNNEQKGVLRFSIVTSGKKPTKNELEQICEIIKEIKSNCDMKICASLGLLEYYELKKLKEAGLSRFHNNLESSENYFKKVCTTHTTQDKIKTIKAAQKAGLSVCSGGIIGLGETFEDRIDMAFLLRELKVKSIPINILNSIKGTPFEKNASLTEEDIIRTCALFRFINPKAFIRLAGGRKLLKDKGINCFQSGINAVISGDMLTTTGISIRSDLDIIKKLGYEVKIGNE